MKYDRAIMHNQGTEIRAWGPKVNREACPWPSTLKMSILKYVASKTTFSKKKIPAVSSLQKKKEKFTNSNFLIRKRLGVFQDEYCVKIHLPGDKDQVPQPNKEENTAKLYFHHFVDAFKNNCHTKGSLDTVAIVADLAKCDVDRCPH